MSELVLHPALQLCLCRVPGEFHNAAIHPAKPPARQLPAAQTRLQTQTCVHHHTKWLPSNPLNVKWLRARDRKLWFAFTFAELQDILRKEDWTASSRCRTNTRDQQCPTEGFPSLQPGSTRGVQRMTFSLPQHHLGSTEAAPQKHPWAWQTSSLTSAVLQVQPFLSYTPED